MHILFTKRVYERFQQLQPATHLNGEIENATIGLKVGGADIVVGAEVLRWLSEPIKLDQLLPGKFLSKSTTHVSAHPSEISTCLAARSHQSGHEEDRANGL